MNKTYAFWKKVLSGFVKWIYNVRIFGSENEPQDGRLLICANHLSNSDVLIIGESFKRQLRFLAKAELFRVPILRSIVKALGAIPVDRKTSDVAAIKHSIKILESGEVLTVFPQGTRCPGRNPKDTDIKFGVAMMAERTEATVLPVFIETARYKIRIFRRTNVRIGKPIPIEELRASGDSYKEQASYIFSKICELDQLDKSGRVYGAEKSDDESKDGGVF